MPLQAGYTRRALRIGRPVVLAAALALGAAGAEPATAQTLGDMVKAGGAPAAAGQTAGGKDDPVVARVDKLEIHRSEVIQVVATLPPQVKQMPAVQVYPLLLDRMIDTKLLAAAGRGQKLQDDAEVKHKVSEYEDRAIQEAYMARAVKDRLTDEALKKKYDAFVAENPPQEEVHARHILVPTEKAAQDVIAELRKGGDFAALAKSKSTDGSAKDGGDLGFFSRGDMVAEFSDAAFAMKPGEVSKAPVKTQFGYHVIKVEERRMSAAPSFEESKDQLKTEMSQELLAQVVEDLRGKAKIERFDLDGKPIAAAKP